MKLMLGCSNKPDLGAGIAVYVRELADQFLRLGCEVHIVSPDPQTEGWCKDRHFHHFSCDERGDQRGHAARLLKYVQEHRIDGIINNDNSVLQSIAPGVACPFVSVGHFGSTSIAALASYQWRWCDYVVAISSDMQKRYVQKYGVPITRCPVIHNGIRDRGHDADYARKDVSVLRAIYAGGNNQFKGADIVLRAALTDNRLWTGIRLDWFGTLPDKVGRRLSRVAHVHVHGHVAHGVLLDFLQNSDVLLFPSRAEGCPMALLEAMSMGVVPIASDGEGAMRWLIESGQNGFICQLKSWDRQLMECLAHLQKNPSSLEHMKRSARARFLKEFDIGITAENILSLLRRPVVDRSCRPDHIDVLRWHRPMKVSSIDRLRFRFGWLRPAGTIQISTAT
jgi:glycosyltransferase involved in cell wall biosynthesis